MILIGRLFLTSIIVCVNASSKLSDRAIEEVSESCGHRKPKICAAKCEQRPIAINKESFLYSSKCQPAYANLKLSGIRLE